MYRITLIENKTNQPYEIDGHKVIIISDNIDYTSSMLLRNRDPRNYRVEVEEFMTRKEWLIKRHRELDAQVTQLEYERLTNRSAEHKALLTYLKKQRLALKTELLDLEASEPVSVN